MRSKLSLFGLLLVLLTVSVMIVGKETALADDRTVLLELVPVDPRSLMQGDYMVLRYALAEKVPQSSPDSGTVFVSLDQHGVASEIFEKPARNRFPLQYRRHEGRVVFDAESYFFQEGHGTFFESAKYGELKVDKKGRPMLVALLDSERQRIEP